MVHDVVVRRLCKSDFLTVKELIRQDWYMDGDPNISERMAAIDALEVLSRTTHALAAELDGEVLGVILGSFRSQTSLLHRLPYRLRQIRLLPSLLLSKEGRGQLKDGLEILRVDGALHKDAGKIYDAEIALFVVSHAVRGKGMGGMLFGEMMGVFRKLGVREYFLFTDTTCNYGFYDHKGLFRRAERQAPADGKHNDPITFFLYEAMLAAE